MVLIFIYITFTLRDRVSILALKHCCNPHQANFHELIKNAETRQLITYTDSRRVLNTLHREIQKATLSTETIQTARMLNTSKSSFSPKLMSVVPSTEEVCNILYVLCTAQMQKEVIKMQRVEFAQQRALFMNMQEPLQRHTSTYTHTALQKH